MDIQKGIAILILAAGLVYAIVILSKIYVGRKDWRSEPGKFAAWMLLESVIYLLATFGISDFLLNTIAFQKGKVSKDSQIPDNLIACCIVPGCLMAYSFLQGKESVEIGTLLLFSLCLIIGSTVGSKIVKRLNGSVIRTAMGVGLLLSMVFVVLKMILSTGVSGGQTELRGWHLVILCVLSTLIGFINMLGVPMKPTATAVLLILGMSPMATLTMVIVLGAVTPISGGIRVIKDGNYNKKIVFCAITGGSVGAIIGTTLAVSIDALFLNIILLITMAVASISLLRRKENQDI